MGEQAAGGDQTLTGVLAGRVARALAPVGQLLVDQLVDARGDLGGGGDGRVLGGHLVHQRARLGDQALERGREIGDVGGVGEGDTVFVYGAAGAVGSVAAQLARLRGARAIGSAGTPEKVAWLDELGLDGTFDYRETETRQAADSYATIFRVLVAIIVVAVVIAIGAAYYLVRDVSRGIASIIRPMQSLGEGDLSAEVPHRGERTEIGSMADALQIFKEALIAKKAADEAAAADAEAKIERGRRVDAITSKFEAMIGEVVGTVSSASTELEASASTLTRSFSTASRTASSPARWRRTPMARAMSAPMCST